jgi:hypothetical protein
MTNRASAKTSSDFKFDRVLNAVDDLGADPNGNEDVVPIIEDNYQSNTKIEFPPGTYKLGSSWVDTGASVSDFGWVGTGTSPRDVQFVVPDSRFNDSKALALKGPKQNHLFRNWSIQLTKNGDRAFPIRIDTKGGCLFEDLEWLGSVADQNTSDQGQVLAVATTTQDGVNTLRRITAGVDAPAERPGYPDGRAFIRFDGSHSGEYILENAHIERQGSSAFRLAAAPGVITVLGGKFYNNDNTNVRFSGGNHPSKHSVIDGAEVVIDNVANVSQAIHVDNSDEYHADAIVKSVNVKVTDPTARQSPIAVPSWGDHGAVSFVNCCVRNDLDIPTIDVGDVDMSNDDIIIDQCHFTGSGKGIDVSGREGSVMQNSCFDMPNGSISGLDTQNISTSGCDDPTFGDSPDTDTSVAVSTGTASASKRSATLNASLDDLGGASSADVYFEYRQADASSWNTTATQTLSSSGSFSQDLSDLASAIDYEFRAAADASDGDTDTGTTATFTTDSGYPNDLKVDGSDIGHEVTYEITVSGEIIRDDRANGNDTISGSTADGQVNGGIDTFDFSGEVTDVQISEDVPIYVNGSQLDLNQFADSGYPNDLKIDGSDIGHEVTYEITVSEDIVKDDRANGNDTISGSTADGQVHGGIDTYDFSGEVTDVRVSEDVPIYVNGSQLDLDRFTDSAPSIDRYEVTEAGSRNPHANITAEWDVSDPDGDLATGLVEVVDSNGAVVDSSKTSVSGDGYYGVDYFEIKNVDGETFDVQLTVTDADGNQTTTTQTVTE